MILLLKNLKLYEKLTILLVVLVPFTPYLLKFVPESSEMNISFITIKSGYYQSISFLLWVLSAKIILLIFLFAWFFTCSHWWKYVILIPLFIEMFKAKSVVSDISYMDEIEFLESLPFTLPILALIIFFSKKINNYTLISDLAKELDTEIDLLLSEVVLPNEDLKLKVLRKEYLNLISKKKKMPVNIYLHRLIKLKNKLYEF